MTATRESLKATPRSTLKDQGQAAAAIIRGGDKIPYHDISPGVNKFRLYPAHPGCKSFIHLRSVWWLPRAVWVDGQGKTWFNPTVEQKATMKTAIKNSPVFNAKVHGKGVDLVDKYVEFAKQMFNDEIDDEIKRIDAIQRLTANMTGLNCKNSWIAYADKLLSTGKTFGFLDVTTATKNQIESLTITEKNDEPIAIDPFTDPDDGVVLKITYTKGVERGSPYKAEFALKGMSLEVMQLSEEEVDRFLKLDSLENIYASSFKRSDLMLQINGLQIFDERNNFGVFEHDGFIEVLEKMTKDYPDDAEVAANIESKGKQHTRKDISSGTISDKRFVAEGKKNAGVGLTGKANIEQFEAAASGGAEDDLDGLDRKALKTIVMEEEADVTVTPKTTDDEIRAAIRKSRGVKAGDSDLPFEVEEDALDEMTRAELKAVIIDEELDVSVKNGVLDGDIRTAIREARKANQTLDNPVVETKQEKPAKRTPKEKPVKTTEKPVTTDESQAGDPVAESKARLAALRAKLGIKNG